MPGLEQTRMNLYLVNGNAPFNGRENEIIPSRFEFQPPGAGSSSQPELTTMRVVGPVAVALLLASSAHAHYFVRISDPHCAPTPPKPIKTCGAVILAVVASNPAGRPGGSSRVG